MSYIKSFAISSSTHGVRLTLKPEVRPLNFQDFVSQKREREKTNYFSRKRKRKVYERKDVSKFMTEQMDLVSLANAILCYVSSRSFDLGYTSKPIDIKKNPTNFASESKKTIKI